MSQVSEMVYEESVRCGKVLGIAVPVPPPEVPDDESSRVYIKFSASSEAAKCKEMMDGRMFDDNKVMHKPQACTVARGSGAVRGQHECPLVHAVHSADTVCSWQQEGLCKVYMLTRHYRHFRRLSATFIMS